MSLTALDRRGHGDALGSVQPRVSQRVPRRRIPSAFGVSAPAALPGTAGVSSFSFHASHRRFWMRDVLRLCARLSCWIGSGDSMSWTSPRCPFSELVAVLLGTRARWFRPCLVSLGWEAAVQDLDCVLLLHARPRLLEQLPRFHGSPQSSNQRIIRGATLRYGVSMIVCSSGRLEAFWIVTSTTQPG